jgi:hypothetical protein
MFTFGFPFQLKKPSVVTAWPANFPPIDAAGTMAAKLAAGV